MSLICVYVKVYNNNYSEGNYMKLLCVCVCVKIYNHCVDDKYTDLLRKQVNV